MAKIQFDKYYTPPTTARWCIEKVYDIIGKENITEIVEPSAGCGMFSNQIDGCKAYDLYPQSEYVEQADFLKLDLGYKKGRLFIGNPPFGGQQQKLIRDFYEKCVKEGDYIAFILPPSHYYNYRKFSKFEILYSCILNCDYSGEELKTSFVIYKRNPDVDRFKEEVIDLKDLSIKIYVRSNKNKHKKVSDYDYCVNCWGNNILGETSPYKHAKTFAITIHNQELKNEIITCIKWLSYKHQKLLKSRNISAGSIEVGDLKRLLKICIPELK